MKVFKKIVAVTVAAITSLWGMQMISVGALDPMPDGGGITSICESMNEVSRSTEKCSSALASLMDLEIESFEVVITYTNECNSKLSREKIVGDILSDLNISKNDAIISGKMNNILCTLSNKQVIKAMENERIKSICLSGELPELQNDRKMLLTHTSETLPVHNEDKLTQSKRTIDLKHNLKTNSLVWDDNSESHMQWCSIKPFYIICKNENIREYFHSSIIKKEFEIQNANKNTVYNVEVLSADGVEILNQPTCTINEKGYSIFGLEFRVLDACDVGNICFRVSDASSECGSRERTNVVEKNIYCYHDSQRDLISTLSLDTLSSYSTSLKQYLRNIELQGETVISENHFCGEVKNPNSLTDYSITVNGYISWTDVNSGVHPASDYMVVLFNASSIPHTAVSTTYTSSSGGYSCSFPTTSNSSYVKVMLISRGTNIKVTDSSFQIYSYTSTPFQVWNYGQFSYTTSNVTDFGKSVSVQQGLALANKYVYSLEEMYLSEIDVVFPNNGGTYYSYPKIYLEPGDEFDWDVAQHEYGHYVERTYNIADSPGGGSSLSGNIADDRNNKTEGIKVAWVEGWATYFAINLQKQMLASAFNIPNVGDTIYTDLGTSISLDIENLPSENWKGEANVATVCATLFDITDETNTSEDDYIYCSNYNVWLLTRNNECITLSDFIESFYSSSLFTNNEKYKLGWILSRYCVAALPMGVNGIGTNTITFFWYPQGGSVLFPNNDFKVVFLNSNYVPFYYTTSTSASYLQISASEWNYIKSLSPSYYYIQARQIDVTGNTGPYHSRGNTFSW